MGIEGELAERFGIYVTPDAYERFSRARNPLDRGESIQAGARDADREISNWER